ncbi:hypothetical protein EXU85_15630 [Spirosoma sp. KCTC 42546]|uniref:hypothetical protein n=1 Tax=Spirosoma sp. KCTC 42546 TaxID=2520506 RepID=UPI00115AD82E|nr:hypothetical protein [Spirosoma sp. KCTC 42546]QDK79962.1 hypothetical protein EXU85_15630 [Spirosoma sp. KCTC 42546]
MDRDWTDFKALYSNIDGARKAFADSCETVFRKEYSDKNVQQVAVKRGDGGIDIFVGDYGQEPIDVYQCKYFLEEIEQAQKNQIQKSFKTAITSSDYEMKSWTLCIPRTFNQDELKWWAEWKGKREKEYNLKTDFIRLKNGQALIDLMKSNSVYNSIFKIVDSQKIDEILQILKKAPGDNCNYEIKSKSELSNLYDFFNQRGLNINNQLREDISKLFFELTQNSLDYGRAKSCFIEIKDDRIILYDDGNSFNPFDKKIENHFGAGLRFTKIIKDKYADVCDFEYIGKSEFQKNNSVILNFRKAISDNNLIDRCYHFVNGIIYSRTAIEEIGFDICEECDTITFDLTDAKVVPSSMTYFIDYILKITSSFKPKIQIRFSGNDTTREVTKQILLYYYSKEISEQVTVI